MTSKPSSSDSPVTAADAPVKVLVVDDLPEKHLVYRAVLEEPGIDIVSATSGEAALKALLDDEFAVILLDVNMPGMDGFETASLIRRRKRCAHTPIIFVTAYPDEVFALKGYAIGAVDYVLAPFTPNILKTKVGVFVQLYRLTQRVKEQAALQVALLENERARLAAVLDNAADFVGRIDHLGRWRHINGAARRMLGLADDGPIPEELLYTSDQSAFDEGLAHARRDGVWFGENVLHHRSGRPIPVTQVILAHKNEADQIESFSVIARDITDRKQADKTKAQLAAIIESSEDAIVSKDLNGIITSWNHGAEHLFGYLADEVIGKPITILIPPDHPDEEKAILERVRRGQAVEHYETIRRHKDGTLLDISLTVSPLRDEQGRIIGASKIARDITERRRSEEMLSRLAAERAQLLDNERAARADAERLGRLKDEFLATLSHELRTPLNAILGWAKLLQGPQTTPEDLAEGLEIIARNGRIQAHLVDELLDVNRIMSGKVQLEIARVEVAGLVAQAVETVRPAADAKQINLSVVSSADDLEILADPNRIQQVIWNLLTNAIKFTPNGGEVNVALDPDADGVRIIVRDSGEGIPSDFLPFVFDRFRQADAGASRRYGGLGLGLSIVKQLVELHGGSVEAQSEGRGKGATFVVRLWRQFTVPLLSKDPAKSNGSSTDAPDANWQPIPLQGARVLIVDDEPDALNLAKRIFEDCKAHVSIVFTAADAFDHIQREHPHVLISDIGLPVEDGYSLIRRIRQHPDEKAKNVAAVALSAFARPEDHARSLEAGFQAHVSKPVDPQELVRVVAGFRDRWATNGKRK